jgi:hypothetical protein
MKRIKTSIEYVVPEWEFCNESVYGKASKNVCRFCVKRNNGFKCLLYDVSLKSSEGFIVNKTRQCQKDTIRSSDIVSSEIQLNTQDIIKVSIKEYLKLVKQLKKQGCPDELASKTAQDILIGDK